MFQVREKLISKQISIERSEKAKKMRELRKFGKKVSIRRNKKNDWCHKDVTKLLGKVCFLKPKAVNITYLCSYVNLSSLNDYCSFEVNIVYGLNLQLSCNHFPQSVNCWYYSMQTDREHNILLSLVVLSVCISFV